jgi:Predicted flavoproteins
MDDHRFDVIVIGGGAAGLSGALTLVRARRSVLVLDAGEPRNSPAGVHRPPAVDHHRAGRRAPDIVRQRWGLDVLHCPYSHGWEVRDQPIGVLGSGRSPCTRPCCSASGAAT